MANAAVERRPSMERSEIATDVPAGETLTLHMSFACNTGTGKTTVALKANEGPVK
jgi:hypothetical protein